ncbi:DNA-3-methyladenine glycosylase 2 family protein [Marinomonas piezotolerans]|uniref:Methylated-DNA--protein-cysteine methyltransferase n=1 Tax=Marinomonas piezotolerans TaxID=2213058 RepID=A0A370UB02_9GAMM|nr:DNA-3-methyladenine glycosylase 2 family protein [Marinomonas piezotolerans]
MSSNTLSSQQRSAFQQARLARDPRFDGTFFVAVKSTGIFCRPICPARLPNESNVAYYQQALEAMRDGYRPCLRCRPDSAPGSCAWQGAQTTATRAQTLLSNLPPEPISTIAERLGISERYLHKLIHAELGLSPKSVQLYHQLMFAKRLLQQTRLPIEDVASSVGFHSARRLQSMMKSHWSLTPSQLRRANIDGLEQAVPQLTLFLAYRPPYQWAMVRDFLRKRALTEVEEVRDHSYRRVFSEGDVNGWIYAEHQPEHNGFAVSLSIDTLQAAPNILGTLTRVLDLNADPDLIFQALLSAGISPDEAVEGLRLPGVWSVFEAGCRAILGQQVAVKAAISQLNKLTQALGQDNGFGLTFPTPEAVAASDLDFFKMPQARKNTLRAFAHYMATTDTKDFSPDAVLALKGIGPWTLDYIMMRGLSDPDRTLAGDLIVRTMTETLPIQPERAAPWRSYLAIQLWHMADVIKNKEPAMYNQYLQSPCGLIHIQATEEGITAIRFVEASSAPSSNPSELTIEAGRQLDAYFAGQLTVFDLPLAAQGTPFQQNVWQALCAIPFGETRSYQDIANAIDNPKGVRAVGLANGKNPISIVVPCHRVIGRNGKLTGYAGGLERKAALLTLEGSH